MGKGELNRAATFDCILDISSSRDSLLSPGTPSEESGSEASDSSRRISFSAALACDDPEDPSCPSQAARVYPSEYLKTFYALLFLLLGLMVSCLALATVHDQQLAELPLPDVVFRYVPQLNNGLELSEYIIMMITYPTLILIVMHQYR